MQDVHGEILESAEADEASHRTVIRSGTTVLADIAVPSVEIGERVLKSALQAFSAPSQR